MRGILFITFLFIIPRPSVGQVPRPVTTQNTGLIDAHQGPWAAIKITNKAANGLGHRYRARVDGWYGIDGPGQVDFFLYGPQHNAFADGASYLVPLTQKERGWFANVDSKGPISFKRGEGRTALGFIRSWCEHRSSPPTTRLDEWLGLIAHPLEFARIVAAERIVLERAAFAGQMGASRLDRLGAMLLEPEVSLSDRRRVIRLFQAVGGTAGARWLAEHWSLLSPPSVQRAAALVLALHPSAASVRVLRRCTESAQGSIQGRCQQLLNQMLKNRVPQPSRSPHSAGP